MKNLIYAITIIIAVVFLAAKDVATQRTALDEELIGIYRRSKGYIMNLSVRSGHKNENNDNEENKVGKGQVYLRNEQPSYFCDPNNKPPRRSENPPTSIHRLRPGDIDIICAMGDSLTAGNGIFATNILQIFVENRGASWSIGGQGNWTQYLTIPNILKEFNPNLYGYSLSDGSSTNRLSKFNVAELGAMSRDMPYEAKILVKRLTADKMVNLNKHWKLLTILIGNNDFCSDMCFNSNPKTVLKLHEQNMIKTLRFLRDNVPRLMVNIVPAPNLRLLTRMINLPDKCQTTLRFECPCLMGKDSHTLDYYESIILKWVELDSKVANREEFNTETFTVNFQPFTQFGDLPTRLNGDTDYRILSVDCFHLSQRGHAAAANALWNNMLEPHNCKTSLLMDPFDRIACPTFERPYLATRSNTERSTSSET